MMLLSSHNVFSGLVVRSSLTTQVVLCVTHDDGRRSARALRVSEE